ncbi:WD40 repeat-containing protein [Mycena rebaudengoi]|nr:WD40 repeat-containing protein [Mycena rebaudengoi]
MTDEMPMDVDSAPATVPSAEAEELPLPQMDVIIPDPPPIVASPPSATTSASVQPERKHEASRTALSGHTMSISSLKFSPDGSKLGLIRVGADNIIKLWDTYTGVSDIAWSTAGEYLASASDDKTIRIWDMKVGTAVKTLLGTQIRFLRQKSLKVLPAHSDPVTSVSFNHDGTLHRLIPEWDADSGQCLKTLVDDDNPIWSFHVRFSPNSKFVLASTQDSTIRLWNYQTSRCVKTYMGHHNPHILHIRVLQREIRHKRERGFESVHFGISDAQVVQTLEGHRDLKLQAHPTREIIASASMEKDLTIKIWYDEP